MTQLIISLAIVALAAGYAVWRVVRTVRGKGGGCHCSGCPHSGSHDCHCCTTKLPDIDLPEQ